MAARSSGLTPANVTKHLKGIHFPCSRDDMVAHAKRAGAAPEVVELLRRMPETQYSTMADVMKGYGQAKD